MKSFNKKNLILSGLLTILVIALLLFIGSDMFTYSRYETHISSQNSITTAVYLLDDTYQTITVKLPDVLPENNQYPYTFSISNYNNDAHSDTNLKYRIHVRTTTNLHIDYDLFNTLDYEHATTDLISSSNDQDIYGTYFKNMYTDYKTMLYSEDKTDNYTLLLTFPEDNGIASGELRENYREAKYSGIAELIEINIESKQIIATDT